MFTGPIMAAAVAATAPPPPDPAAGLVPEIQVVTRAPLVGDLQQGVQAYRSEFFVPVRPGTAMDMIKWLPGFTFEDTRDVRGLGGAIGNVLIDGQPPTSKTDTLTTVLSRIPANQVDRVDIIVGGAPGIDMRGRPVLANVVLKKTTAPRGSATVSSHVFQDGRFGAEVLANISRKTDARTFEAGINLRRSIFFPDPLIGTGPQTRTDGAGRVLFAARADNRGQTDLINPTAAYEFPLAGGALRINGSWRRLQGRFLEDAVAPGVVSTQHMHDRRDQWEAGLRYTRDFGGGLSLESQALERLSDYGSAVLFARAMEPTTFDLAQDQSETVLRNTLRWKKSERLTLEMSAEGALNGLDAKAARTIGGVSRPPPGADVSIEERRGDLGANLNWKPSEAYGLTAGLRVETSSLTAEGDVNLSRSLTYLKPRLTLSYAPDKRTQVRLRAEHDVSQINFFNFVATAEFTGVVRGGNPNLRPQRAWIAEAVVERQFWTGASLVATLRHQALRDALETRLIPGFGDALEVANIGSGRSTNLIATVTLPLKRWGLDGVMVKGTLNRTLSRVTDPTTGQARPISFMAGWAGEVHLVHDLPDWKINWGVDYTHQGASEVYRPFNIDQLPAFGRLSAFVEYRARPNLTLRAEAFNLNSYRGDFLVTYFTAARPSPVLYSDRRQLGGPPYFMLRARRTLN